MTKQQQLEALRQEILDAGVCAELAAGATQLVMGDGSADAQIVFIGEAPGKQEDLQGLPFVGASGKFLNSMLESAGLVRSDVYITNIVKYRPPDNRDPTPQEKRDFWPYLLRQLEIIHPKVVITLGRHSMECFIPDAKISTQHGKAKRVRYTHRALQRSGTDEIQGADEHRTVVYEQYPEGEAEAATQELAASYGRVNSTADEQAIATWLVVPLYHPAAALYNGSLRQVLIDDFVRACGKIHH